MKKIAFSIIVLTIFFACKKNETPTDNTPAALTESIKLNEAYGTDGNQKMDIYLPANRTANTKVILVIHGGAWFSGDKADMQEYVDSLRKRLPSYAFANINYRLAFNPINIYPTANNDVTSAINYIVGKKTDYVVDDKFAVLGVSAGGHLALYEGFKNTTGKVKMITSIFGIPDMNDMWDNPAGTPWVTQLGLNNYLGFNKPANAAVYTAASPTTYVTAQSVPTQLFHGTADTLVRYQQSVALKNKLQTLNVPVQYTEYAGSGHGWTGARLTDTYTKIEAFIKQYLP